MRIKPTTAYEVKRIYYDINVVNLLYIVANFCGHLLRGYFSKDMLQRQQNLCKSIKY